MSSPVEDDAGNSFNAFVDLVAPVIEKWTGGEVANIEDVTDKGVANKLDTVAGVDAWDIKTDTGIRGVASRCQPIGPFDTFTVRYKRSSGAETEFQKRKRQINNNYLYPHWTVQAYYDDNDWRLESAAMAKTQEIIKFIEHGSVGDESTWYSDGFGEGDYWEKGVKDRDGTLQKFYCIDWRYLRESGVGVQIVQPYKNPEDRVVQQNQAQLGSF